MFIALNDAELVATEQEKYIAMLSLAEGSLEEAAFAEWLRPRLVLSTQDHVNEPKAAYR